MTPLDIALTVAVLTLLWWAANPLNANHIENDEATSRGSVTRTTDPSIPRTWDSLDAVDADVDRVTGDYVGMRRELARGELSGSGWFQRVVDNAPRRWAELPAAETNNITNIQEDQ